MKSIYEKLEFDRIKDILKTYAHNELTLSYINNLKMFEKDVLKDELKELKEVLSYLKNYKGLPFYNIKNIMKELISLLKEGYASIDFFATVSLMLENVMQIKKEFVKDNNFPVLNSYVADLKEIESLKNRIDSVIASDLTIFDTASSNLNSIRFQIRKEEINQPKIVASLMNKYHNYLNDERMALKNKGLTLPIKVTYKNRVDGVVVDVSSSGNTCFIMPLEILLSNNKIETLKEQEQQEILIILKDLARIASSSVEDLRRDLIILSHLDYLFAKASYAFDLKANVGEIASNFNLVEARHPLIDQSIVVANSFTFTKEKIMLITGPNAGGKTVALKTLGLLVLMHQCGLAIPSIEAYLPYFDNIFIDIGDEQSLLDNLSTFTSHMRTLKEAISNVNETSLVLIDELGSGTSPKDGEALAIGVIKYLHNSSCYALISSHYDGLKTFALNNDYILNASMIFDEEKLRPTYKILLGVAGKSFGLEVAKREGIPLSIIEDAKNYLKEQKDYENENTLANLNLKYLEVESLKKLLEEKNKELENTLKKQKDELNALKNEKEKLKENFEEEKEALLLNAKQEVEEMMEQFKNKKDVKMHEVISLKKQIDDKINASSIEEEKKEVEEFKVNDRVLFLESGTKGYLKSINKNNGEVILDNGLTLKTKLSVLTHVALNNVSKKKPLITYSTKINYNVPLEVNVIGMYKKEALDVIKKYLDDAIKMKYHRVRIVHGNGQGILRQAIHEYLRKQSFVESFAIASYYEGGTGATVVNLK